jgi:hypothetical protein
VGVLIGVLVLVGVPVLVLVGVGVLVLVAVRVGVGVLVTVLPPPPRPPLPPALARLGVVITAAISSMPPTSDSTAPRREARLPDASGESACVVSFLL